MAALGIAGAVSAFFDGVGAKAPIRPKHIHYPDPPQLVSMVLLKMIFGLAIGILIGATFGTEAVGAAAHGAKLFGTPLSPGIYSPTDIFGWFHFDNPATFTREEVDALNSAHVSPIALRDAFLHAKLALGIGTLVGFVFGVLVASKKTKMPRALAGLKGSAEWASYADAKRAGLVWDGVTPGVFLGWLERPRLFGIFPRALVPLVYGGPRHILQNAASRSGKDVGTNTYTAIVTWHQPRRDKPGCSALWNDPKGEGHLQTSGIRYALFDNDIVRFAPLAPKIGDKFLDVDDDGSTVERVERFGSTHWSPHHEVAWGTDFEFSDCLQMVSMISDPTGKLIDDPHGGHWVKTSRTVIKALDIKVQYDPLEPIKSISRVAELFGSAGGSQSAERETLKYDTDGAPPATIEEMLEQFLGFNARGFGSRPAWLRRSEDSVRLRAEREILVERDRIGLDRSEADVIKFEAERRRALDKQIERMNAELRHPDLERDLRNTLRIKGEESGSVFSTVNANLSPWLDPLVIQNTSFSGFKILDLVTRPKPVTCYVVSSIARADMAFPIVKLFWTMAYRKLVPEMEMDAESKRTLAPWRHKVLFLMNERGSIKNIEVEQEVVPVGASYGLLFDYLFQTPRQLRAIAGEDDVIAPNCGIQVWHTPQEPEDQKMLSERLGNKTVLVEQHSHAKGGMTRSWQTEQMQLMTPEQTGMMPTEPKFEFGPDPETGEEVVTKTISPAYQVIFAPNCGPIYSRKAQWFTSPKLRKLIGSVPAVVPYALRSDRTRDLLTAAKNQVETTPLRRETESRSRARIAEAVELERIDLPDAPPPRAPDPEPTPAPPAAGGLDGRKPRKRRVVAMDERIVERSRGGAASDEHDVGAGFGSILGGD
jgi:type IV secretory pathway TraG/TraD family ATPase VirD4